MIASSLDLPELIHELGRGARGARSLSRAETRALFAAMLDGTVGDLELGALLIAYRIKGETADELAGMLDAAQATLECLVAPAADFIPAVIPSYNGARKLANLTPLLALALARRGIPVLVHGDAADEYGRISSASVFAALGIPACRDRGDIESALHTQRLAFAPVDVLAPALAGLLHTRARIGVRGPAHMIAKLLQPFATPALRLVNYTHPSYRDNIAALFADAGLAGPAGVLLARGSEGEAVADPRRQVAVEWLRNGAATALIDPIAMVGPAPDLPTARDAATTARWIERALAGLVEWPESLTRQVDAIERICNHNNARGDDREHLGESGTMRTPAARLAS